MFVQDGVYPVTLTVTDNDGLTDTATLSVTVTNVAPVVGAIPDASLDDGAALHGLPAVHRPGRGCLDRDGGLG